MGVELEDWDQQRNLDDDQPKLEGISWPVLQPLAKRIYTHLIADLSCTRLQLCFLAFKSTCCCLTETAIHPLSKITSESFDECVH